MIDEMLKEAMTAECRTVTKETAAGTVRVQVTISRSNTMMGMRDHFRQQWKLNGRRIAKADLARELSKVGCL